MELGHVYQRREVGQADRLGEVPIDVVVHAAQGDHGTSLGWNL